ncbi:MAG: HNH endonuclease [Clostridia bacterium]|nr:HNH endonuclease [Clostridia bacterium]
MIKVYQDGREVASFPTTNATAKAVGCVYTTIHSRLQSGKPYKNLTFKKVDDDVRRIAIFKHGARVHTGYSLEHASKLTGLCEGKIEIMIAEGSECKGWSFDEDEEQEYPRVKIRNGESYHKIYNGYRNRKTKVYLHRVVAREIFGDIPKNKRVHFRDKNPCNCDPDNLYLTD